MSAPADLPRRRSTPRSVWVAGLLLVSLVAAGAWLVYERSRPSEVAAGPGVSARGPGGAGRAGSAGGRPGRPGRGSGQPVSAGVVKRMDMHQWVTALGTLTARNTAIVRPKVDGELVAVLFKEGQRVQAGEVLARVDAASYKQQLVQVQSQLAKNSAQLANARLDLSRYQDLLDKGAIARQQVETQKSLVAQLQGTVEADKAQIELAQLQLGYTQVRAPISGVLGLRQVDLGSLVRSSDPNGLVSITQVNPMTVVFAVPDAQVGDLRRRMNAKQAVVVQAWSRDDKLMLAQGRVSSTDNAIDTSTGTLKVKAELPNPKGELFPNQFVNVRLLLNELKDTLAVPVPAVQRGAMGTFVYVVGGDGKVRTEKVDLKLVEGDWQAVDGKLQVDEQVVTDGADRLRTGSAVEVVNQDSAKRPAARKP
jgi:multidrug efflux system membrane fusion protein